MCGIAGIIRKQSGSNFVDDEAAIASSLSCMQYRGPDHSAVVRKNNCTLGHNRLSILDLSAMAHQPMTDASGDYSIVFNGEIFNYQLLRKNLESEGEVFQTNSDTEVLLRLLIRKGKDALNELNGFFAFAFYDHKTAKLLLARDRYGEKPLYYFHGTDHLCFASQLNALQKLGIPDEIDIVSLSLLLQLTYIPAPHTILAGVRKLEGGHLIEYHNGETTKQNWYQPEVIHDEKANTHQVQKHFRNLLQDAVKIRTHADVPVGCFLSGGADSSVIALLASQCSSNISTYSIGFSDHAFLDETPFAKNVAAHIGSHHEVFMLSAREMLVEVNRVLREMDEPFADSSSIAVSLLSSMTKKSVTVALSGDGADELLGGYHKYRALQLSMKHSSANVVLDTLNPILRLLPEGRTNGFTNKMRQIKKYASLLNLDLKSRYLALASWTDASLCERLINQELILRRGARLNAFVQDIRQEDFNTVLFADQKLVLANDMLCKIDRMSMLNSLEVRPPFLDHRVVEFVNALPIQYKVNDDRKKILLSDTFAKELPAEVFNRKKKGFEVPLEKWLRSELKPMVMENLSGTGFTSTDVLNDKEVQSVLHDFYYRGKRNLAPLIYALLVFETWRKRQAG